MWVFLVGVALFALVMILDGKGRMADSLVIPVMMIVALVLMAAGLAGCSTLGQERQCSPSDARDIAQEAACQPLPVCDIPPDANAKQLASALWACVLEYRGLYSQCMHLVEPVPIPHTGVTPGTGYGYAYCDLTNPPRCSYGKGGTP